MNAIDTIKVKNGTDYLSMMQSFVIAGYKSGECGMIDVVEAEVIKTVFYITGDIQFPLYFRERILNAIAQYRHFCIVPACSTQGRVFSDYDKRSYLIDLLILLFTELADRNIVTRFGALTIDPREDARRRDSDDGFVPEHVIVNAEHTRTVDALLELYGQICAHYQEGLMSGAEYIRIMRTLYERLQGERDEAHLTLRRGDEISCAAAMKKLLAVQAKIFEIAERAGRLQELLKNNGLDRKGE